MMKKSQKIALAAGTFVAIVMVLFPPFEIFGGYLGVDIGYSFVACPPFPDNKSEPSVVAWGLLSFQLVFVSVASLIAFWLLRERSS